MDCILAFGDSHIAGFETVPWDRRKCNIEEHQKETKTFSFPNLIANHFNVPCYNYSMVGSSNDRTLRLLPEKILLHKNPFVIIGHSEYFRTEIFNLHGTGHKDSDNFLQMGVGTVDAKSNVANKWIEVCDDWRGYNNYKQINSIFYIDQICKKFAKNYLQMFLFDGYVPTEFQTSGNYRAQLEILAECDLEKIFKFKQTKYSNLGFGNIVDWGQESALSMPNKHLSIEGHQVLAKDIVEKIKT